MSAPHEHLETSFPDTQPLSKGLSSEARSLLAGHLGDASYQILSKSEQLELLQKMEQARQAATLVVINTNLPPEDQLVFVFNSNVFSLDETQERMEFDLPMAAPHIGRGLTLRGSIKLQGVILTFECEVVTTRHSSDGKDNALVTSLPSRLFRLQRRDSFRVPVPNHTLIHVTLKSGIKHLERVRVLDVSCGGLSALLLAPLEQVRVGARFPSGTLYVETAEGNSAYEVDLIVKHSRIAPQGLSQFLSPRKETRQSLSKTDRFREDALRAVGASAKPELLQLGIEFGRTSMNMDRTLSKLVNELAISLMSRTRDDV